MDELLEWKNQDSAGYSVPYTESVNLKFADYLKSENKMSTNRINCNISGISKHISNLHEPSQQEAA